MINYIDTKNEIEILRIRIDCLKNEREELSSLVSANYSRVDRINVQEIKIPDKKIIEYIHRITIIDKKIKEKSEQLNFLEQKLEEMEKLFKKSVGINHKIFTMRYIDGLKADQISRRVGYSVRSVYRILETVNQK
ncbi:MAG: hypothetical protein LBJ32_04155 [Oscillospiraceae bacterium]|nr:hypothetical protein [Oscillospiraceae bacterium]